MALKATVFKIELQIANMDRHYYENHSLTVAQHPSENDRRMMWRVVAFCLNASDQLTFCKGVSTDDEPDLWQKSLSDEIELWIDLGQPDEKRLRKACGRADHVQLYAYQPRSARVWWEQQGSKLQRFNNLSVNLLQEQTEDSLIDLVDRTMELQVNIQDGELWLGNQSGTAHVTSETWKKAGEKP